jgi:hypothetical protein
MRVLTVPPAAQRDDNAIQMLSAWVAEQGLHCSMKVGMWQAEGRNEPDAWGILLADVVRHLASALQSELGTNAADSVEQIVESLLQELNAPTSEASGGFHSGHS